MKRILLIVGVFTVAICNLNAQAPESFSYQAIARDTNGLILQDQNVGMKISLLQGSANGTLVYAETHQTATNSYGLLNLSIGNGTPVFGVFQMIDWGINSYFIKTEIDITGGSSYIVLGTSKLLSVPYALYAKTFDNLKEIDPQVGNNIFNYLSKWNGSALMKSSVYDNGYVGIGTNSPSTTFEVSKIVNAGNLSLFRNTSSAFGSISVKAEGSDDTKGFLGVIGDNTFDAYSGFDIPGDEIGVLGLSLGTSTPDNNFGLFGYSNSIGVYGKNSESGRSGYLGGINFGAYGEYSSNNFGYLGGVSYGAWGQYNSTNFGYLGSDNCGVYGSSSTSYYTGYGGYFVNTSTNNNSVGVFASAAFTGTSNISNTNGIYATSTSTANDLRGIYNYVDHTGTLGNTYGQLNNIDIAAGNTSTARGIYVNIERDANDATTYGLYVSALNGTTVYGVYSRAFGGSTNYAGYFDGDLAYNGTLINASDRKFKENIKPISGSLAKIKELNVYSYTFKTRGEAESMNFSQGTQFGFIAQELEKVFPELVSENVHVRDENVVEGERFSENEIRYKGVNYIGMIPVLTEAIKEQQTIIEEQQHQIDELKLMVNQLMK